MNAIALKRIHKDFFICGDLKDEFNIQINPHEDNLFIWDIIFIPKYSIYKDVPLNFIIKFPQNYPFKEPTINVPYYIRHYYIKSKQEIIEKYARLLINFNENEYIDYCDYVVDIYCDILSPNKWNYTLNIRTILLNLYYIFNIEFEKEYNSWDGRGWYNIFYSFQSNTLFVF